MASASSLDPVRRAEAQVKRDRLWFLAWVLGLVALLVMVKTLAGPCC